MHARAESTHQARRGLRALRAAAILAALSLLLSSAPLAAAEDEELPSCAAAVGADGALLRASGPDRFATAACLAAVRHPNGSAEVILARGDAAGGLADALAGGVLAHARRAPLLLTEPETLPAATAAALDELGAETVTILGGTSAVSSAVADEVAARVAQVARIAGRDRFATAAAISAAAGGQGTVFVVNGFRPADSLVAVPPAARAGAALLLTGRAGLPEVTAAAVDDAEEVVIVGGHGVVSEAVAADLRRRVGADRVRRVAGGTRAETAAAVARAFGGQQAGGALQLAAGADARLADAAAAGPAAAAEDGGVVLYAEGDRPGRGTDRFLRLGALRTPQDGARTMWLIGGTAALSSELVSALEDRYAEAAAGGRAPELRGVWVQLFDGSLKSRAGIHRMLDAAAAANLNTVVVQAVRRHDAYSDSSVLPRTPDPAMPADLDLLAELVPAAHDRGLDVHAWISTLPAYHRVYDELELGPQHIWTRHGPQSADPWTTRSVSGESSVYLDPGVPGVQDHIAAVVGELARTGVDAVHLDYVRYDGAAWGYHPTSLARFRAQTGRSGTPAPDDPAWGQWRRRQTEDLARRAFINVVGADPGVAVSMAASTMGAGPTASGGYTATRTYRDVFQDWPRWLAEGVVDAAIPMNYFRERVAEHRAWFDDWVAFEAALPRGGRPLAIGQAGYLNSVDDSLSQLGRARARTDGFVVYSYQQDTATEDPRGLLAGLADDLVGDPAPAPELPGRSPTHGFLLVRAADGVRVELVAESGQPAPAPLVADATGRAGFVRVPVGDWQVRAPGYASASVTVPPAELSTVTLQPTG